MLMTLQQFCENYPWPTEAGLRNIVYNLDKKDYLKPFQNSFKWIGSRVLIDDEEFFRVFEEENIKNRKNNKQKKEKDKS